MTDGVGDFDFLNGRWTVRSRRLKDRLVGSDAWDAFEGEAWNHSFFDGAGNWDEISFPSQGFKGQSLRLLNRATGEWSIYWANSLTGTIFTPTIGRFEGEGAARRGDFYGDDEEGGRPIRVHFSWSDITPTSAVWAQEFSADGGATWERNWVMEFSRVA
ncbi:MAG TPA: hypothetical protein VGJ17_04790 [Candidatus Limnocylindrales bacterium]